MSKNYNHIKRRFHKNRKEQSLSAFIRQRRNAFYAHYWSNDKNLTNLGMNQSFLREYNSENGLEIEDDVLKVLAYKFNLWEQKFVFSFENGYEDFREKVIWLDYDEILEMYIEDFVHPSVMPSWQSESNYSFFIGKILPQIKNIATSRKNSYLKLMNSLGL